MLENVEKASQNYHCIDYSNMSFLAWNEDKG